MYYNRSSNRSSVYDTLEEKRDLQSRPNGGQSKDLEQFESWKTNGS